ncbi:MAG: four helix bundle protein [Verrucomicrobia bacterium]|nr:four helix bundle protein [Verrucomicrobiota bacterium]
MLAHEKLHVYQKALSFVGRMSAFSSEWPKRHAVTDQLARASESVLTNLAEAARAWGNARKVLRLDYALGSSIECAACIDIAEIKEFVRKEAAEDEKRALCEITRMLFGLRKAWQRSGVSESREEYQGGEGNSCFHHEQLDLYRASLDVVRWLSRKPEGIGLSDRTYRQLDTSVTSTVLNIAEGNGRFATLDNCRFLDIAHSTAVRASTLVDLLSVRERINPTDALLGKDILLRVTQMLNSMSAVKKRQYLEGTETGSTKLSAEVRDKGWAQNPDISRSTKFSDKVRDDGSDMPESYLIQ